MVNPIKKYLWLLLLLFAHNNFAMQQEVPYLRKIPRYNTITQKFSAPTLKDLAAHTVASNFLTLCSALTTENIDLLYNEIQNKLLATPEELQKLIEQHMWYCCYQYGYKVNFLDDTAEQISYTKPTNFYDTMLLIEEKNNANEVSLFFNERISSYCPTRNNEFLAILLADATLHIYTKNNDAWKKQYEKKFELFAKTRPHNAQVYFVNNKICIIIHNNNLFIFPWAKEQKLDAAFCNVSLTFDPPVTRVYVINNRHFFASGFNSVVYSCKKIDKKWDACKINTNKDCLGIFYPSHDGQLCLIVENGISNVYINKQDNEWQLARQIQLPFITENCCYFKNNILGFVRYQFRKRNHHIKQTSDEIKSGQMYTNQTLKETVSLYSLITNKIVGIFKKKSSSKEIFFDLNPGCPAILASILFSKSQNDSSQLKEMYHLPFLATLPQKYKEQLDKKIQTKLSQLNLL